MLVLIIQAGAFLKKMNYYTELGLENKASKDDIRKAYLSLVKQYHPDSVPDEGKTKAEEKFKIIQNAYAVLSNEKKRKEYDQSLTNQKEPIFTVELTAPDIYLGGSKLVFVKIDNVLYKIMFNIVKRMIPENGQYVGLDSSNQSKLIKLRFKVIPKYSDKECTIIINNLDIHLTVQKQQLSDVLFINCLKESINNLSNKQIITGSGLRTYESYGNLIIDNSINKKEEIITENETLNQNITDSENKKIDISLGLVIILLATIAKVFII